MDIIKLFEMVLGNEDTKDIPVLYVILIFNSVIDAINTGECFYKMEIE